jgi:hypothetical protein
MAALLDRIHLRRNALPAGVADQLDHEIDRRAMRSVMSCPAIRPRLIASWHIGTTGRPVCSWSVTEAVRDVDLDRPSR